MEIKAWEIIVQSLKGLLHKLEFNSQSLCKKSGVGNTCLESQNWGATDRSTPELSGLIFSLLSEPQIPMRGYIETNKQTKQSG